MKYILACCLLVFSISVVAQKKVVHKNDSSKRVPKSDTTLWVAEYVVNGNTWVPDKGPVKMMITTGYFDVNVQKNDSTVTRRKMWLTDTIYLLPTVDSLAPLLDQSGKLVLDSLTHLPYYFYTFRSPTTLPRDLVHLLFPIPSRYLYIFDQKTPPPRQQTASPDTHPPTNAANK